MIESKTIYFFSLILIWNLSFSYEVIIDSDQAKNEANIRHHFISAMLRESLPKLLKAHSLKYASRDSSVSFRIQQIPDSFSLDSIKNWGGSKLVSLASGFTYKPYMLKYKVTLEVQKTTSQGDFFYNAEFFVTLYKGQYFPLSNLKMKYSEDKQDFKSYANCTQLIKQGVAYLNPEPNGEHGVKFIDKNEGFSSDKFKYSRVYSAIIMNEGDHKDFCYTDLQDIKVNLTELPWERLIELEDDIEVNNLSRYQTNRTIPHANSISTSLRTRVSTK